MRKQYHFRQGADGLSAWDVDAPTVRQVVEHCRLIAEVDLGHPIVVDPEGQVMDGMHRVARALLEGHPAIAAKRLPALPEPDYVNCRPADLPY